MTANAAVCFVVFFFAWAILQRKCMSKLMKVCIGNNPAFAVTILERAQELKPLGKNIKCQLYIILI